MQNTGAFLDLAEFLQWRQDCLFGIFENVKGLGSCKEVCIAL